MTINKLPERKRGRPYLLGEKLEMQVRAYLQTLRVNGTVVNTSIAIGCAKGIAMNEDINVLACNGGHIALTKHWAKHLLGHMEFVKRRASTKAKVSVEDFEAVKSQFLIDVKAVVEVDKISHKLIINWDQVGGSITFQWGHRLWKKKELKGLRL